MPFHDLVGLEWLSFPAGYLTKGREVHLVRGPLHLIYNRASVVCPFLLQPNFQEECKFRETLLPNNYNAYESDLYRGTYIALSKYGRVKRGSKVSPIMTVTHFLPRI